jgi:hypothetical protein
LKENKEKEAIDQFLRTKIDVEEEFLKIISSSILNKKGEIIEFLNSRFSNGFYILKEFDWRTKSILASNRDNYLNERFADLEFMVHKVKLF